MNVGKCDIDVMGSDVSGATGSASPFFPAPTLGPTSAPPVASAAPTTLKLRVAVIGGLSRGELTASSSADLRGTLEGLLAALKNVTPSELQRGERHADGSLEISSHLAVWLIGKVTDAYGSKLVRLSKVSDREALRSMDGLARLLTTAIATKGRKVS